ncbi:PREDICTED: uncharacterized protein LOC109234895 [Nicotiana attenuata]|uniref:uncharacterized protein LOC109234895 n=1 Tax=Nicotiana attenuata TaxID=49451 RepID=UPI00090535DB|nr:PREDICTED: uncharacterized protein LOC109234895 [Nicotiana attenuata]
MSWMAWNIRGTNKRYKQKELGTYIKENNIKLVGLVETRVKKEKATQISQLVTPGWQAQYNYEYAINGGIWILWDPQSYDITVLGKSAQTIHGRVVRRHHNINCLMTVVYGFNTIEERKPSWQQLKTDAPQNTEPWIIWGDFNSQGSDRVYSRIDRALGNDEWMQEYGHMEAEYRLPFISDHAPMVISIRRQVPNGKIPFRFFNVWAEHPRFMPLVEEVWKEQQDQDSMKNIWQKLKILKPLLKQLNNSEFKGITDKLESTRSLLQDIQAQISKGYLDKLANEEKQVLEYLEKWSLIEESILQQKARATWLRLGDANSKYFSAIMKEKRQRKVITELQDCFGNKLTGQ